MSLASQDKDNVRVVTVEASRIDAAGAIHFKDAMRELTQSGPDRIVLDLARVDFVDSSGLGAIVAAMKQMGPERRMDLAGARDTVLKVFRLTRMDTVFRLFPDVDAALSAGDK
jgi:anti-sigma B factor antagonist